ncbi:MAG: hypothetical protein WCD76_06065, partial [Pyrinomonadaceae bacterium]
TLDVPTSSPSTSGVQASSSTTSPVSSLDTHVSSTPHAPVRGAPHAASGRLNFPAGTRHRWLPYFT